MKTLFQKFLALFIFCFIYANSVHAQVLFETNFQAAEGWVTEGAASSTGTLIERTITYNTIPYLFKLNQIAINVTDAASGECSIGTANIQKNGKSDYLQISTTATNNGYILLPDFNEDIQVSFAQIGRASCRERV